MEQTSMWKVKYHTLAMSEMSYFFKASNLTYNYPTIHTFVSYVHISHLFI